MNKELRKGLRTWIEIDKKAIKNNYRIFRSLIPKKCRFMAVVKSNAYGHNILEFSKEVENLGVDYLGVDSIVEAMNLRKNGIKKPILVLGYTLPEMIREAVKNNIEISVSTFETLKFIQKNNLGKIKIHIKVDTGMGRHGFLPSDFKKLLTELKNTKNIEVVGLFTHFASAKDPKSRVYTNNQIKIFENWIKNLKKEGYMPICHASATSGTMIFPNSYFDMVRVGIGLYGIWPSKETKKFMESKYVLQPALSWKTLVSEIKELPKGSKIGYDSTEILKEKSKVVICPIGYWHGYSRSLSGIGNVLINGVKCKILGRMCMDIVMADATRVKKIKVGDEVVIIGKSKSIKNTADDIAKLSNTSPYEIVTKINPLIKRLFI